MADFTLNYTGNEINTNLGLAATAIQPTNLASTTAVGVVKVDGTTITAATDGTISGTKNVQLYYNGTNILDKKGGTVLTYTDIYTLITNEKNVLSVNYADSNVLYPTFWTGDAIAFSNIAMIDSKSYNTRLIINAQNQILYDEEELVERTDYATTTTAGVVKPDGTTITVAADGTISGAAQGANQDLSNLTATGEAHFAKTADITSAVSTHNSSTTAHTSLFNAKANVRTLVANTTDTTATLTLAENTDYTYSQPLTSLTISNGITTMNEATVTFTAGSTITVSIPTTVKNLGAEVEFEANGTYTMSFWNGFVIIGVQS